MEVRYIPEGMYHSLAGFKKKSAIIIMAYESKNIYGLKAMFGLNINVTLKCHVSR